MLVAALVADIWSMLVRALRLAVRGVAVIPSMALAVLQVWQTLAVEAEAEGRLRERYIKMVAMAAPA
jgi:hypothetical protein